MRKKSGYWLQGANINIGKGRVSVRHKGLPTSTTRTKTQSCQRHAGPRPFISHFLYKRQRRTMFNSTQSSGDCEFRISPGYGLSSSKGRCWLLQQANSKHQPWRIFVSDHVVTTEPQGGVRVCKGKERGGRRSPKYFSPLSPHAADVKIHCLIIIFISPLP
jgi:hypothetical protein